MSGTALQYNVHIIDRYVTSTGASLLSYANHTSTFPYAYNPAWMPSGGPGGSLIVRVQPPSHTGYGSYFAVVGSTALYNFNPITPSALIPWTYNVPSCGFLDPRAFVSPSGKTWMIYQTLEETGNGRHSWLAWSETPMDPNAWNRLPVPMIGLTLNQSDCSAVVFFPYNRKDDSGAYGLFTLGVEYSYGGNITLGKTTDATLSRWTILANVLEPRPDHWDSRQLTPAAQPVLLTSGDWLLLYDVDLYGVKEYPWWGRVGVGWAILDGKDVSHVLQRSESPLLWAESPWELNGLTPLCIYATGIQEHGDDQFTVYYGGADTVVGATRFQVVYQ
jgi:predicted GH43/DUF377 family glycosyl hydrolase